MIKAKELRIGNLVGIGVKICNINSIHVVGETNEAHFRVSGFADKDPQHCIYNYQCEGVPLTPELLIACGFEKLEHHHWQLPQIGLVGTDEYIEYYGETLIGKPMKYLHEVQNRFYSHTGIELEINL